jgi:hypothetical protein
MPDIHGMALAERLYDHLLKHNFAIIHFSTIA